MFCKRCGKYNEDSSAYCSGCGLQLNVKKDNTAKVIIAFGVALFATIIVIGLLLIVFFIGSGNFVKSDGPTQDELMSKLALSTNSGYVLESRYDDFDRNGQNEMFAVVYDDSKYAFDGNTEYSQPGEVWYVDELEAVCLLKDKSFYLGDGVSVIDLGTEKIFKIEEGYMGSASMSHAWILKKNVPIKLNNTGMGMSHYGNNDFTTRNSTFDYGSDGSGHTWKVYYLYLDGTSLKEYGGIKISLEDFMRLEDGNRIIDEIIKEGYNLDTIYYRANDIININCYTDEINENVTVKVENGKALVLPGDFGDSSGFVEKSTYGGVYNAAMYPEIATYPEDFPY